MANKISINIPAIRKTIKKIHGNFVTEYGMYSDKVMSDYRLLAERVASRIVLIANCLKQEKVIDTIKVEIEGPLHKITLKRNDSDNFVQIATTGQSIHFMGYTYTIGDIGLDISNRQKTFSNVFSLDKLDIDEYDWVKFSEALLDFVHCIVYDRKEAFAVKMKSDLARR